MKKSKKIIGIVISVLFALSISLTANGQESCQVLKVGIDSAYQGTCKKDLAHGVGEAWGRDHYFGEFKKGLPHGKGTYEFYDGSVYVGAYSKGLRHGYGEYTPNLIETDTILKGMWEKDHYMGQQSYSPGYKVLRKVNLDRYRVIRTSDEAKVVLKINTNYSAKQGAYELVVSGTSGRDYTNSGYHGFENVTFPFSMNVRYLKWNRLGTAMQEVLFEIEISEPGEWRVELN